MKGVFIQANMINSIKNTDCLFQLSACGRMINSINANNQDQVSTL